MISLSEEVNELNEQLFLRTSNPGLLLTTQITREIKSVNSTAYNWAVICMLWSLKSSFKFFRHNMLKINTVSKSLSIFLNTHRCIQTERGRSDAPLHCTDRSKPILNLDIHYANSILILQSCNIFLNIFYILLKYNLNIPLYNFKVTK